MKPPVKGRLSILLLIVLVGLVSLVSLAFGTGRAVARSDTGANDVRTPPPPSAVLGGTVTFTEGSPVTGLVIDLFEANADGSRGRWLGDVRTDSSGVFSWSVAPGCYVLTYIAPEGGSFVGGGMYFQVAVCVKGGDKVTDLDARLISKQPRKATVSGMVRFDDGSPVVALVVDFFEANADGSRGTWLGDEISDDRGAYRRGVTPGCYVLVFIAPPAARFVDGGVFLEVLLCVKDRATVDATMVALEPCTIQGQAVVTPLAGPDCDALLALFDSTGGPDWIDRTGWNTPTDPCRWFGVRCGEGTVTELSLPFNGLSGPLPADLALLADLRNINMTGNRLTGPIPAGLGQRRLSFLNLGQNQLSGPIPRDLRVVFVLDLGDNELSGPIPPELGQVDAVFIMLQGNQLSGPIPPELGQLARAQDLVLDGNRLSGTIPAELGRIANLSRLGLSGNQLSGPLPSELGDFPALRFLELDGNQLTGDITGAMAGLRSTDTMVTLSLSDGPGRNDCLTVTDTALAAWISGFDPDWAECD